MTFTLEVDGPRWRAHAAAVAADVRAALAGPDSTRRGDVVPVAKGNGYGLGNHRLARESGRLGAGTLAVGTVFEVAAVAPHFDGDLVVLEPFDPRDTAARHAWAQVVTGPDAHRVIRVLADPESVAATVAEAVARDQHQEGGDPRPRVLLEGLTSMQRFGMDEPTVATVLAHPDTARWLRLEGLTLHLPLVQPTAPRRPAAEMLRDTSTGMVERGSARTRECVGWALLWTSWLADLLGDGAPDRSATLWVSHLDDGELRALRADLPDQPVQVRAGTRLWHGDRSAMSASGTVLAVQRAVDGVGYSQRRGGGDVVVVVSGGTAHGVGLEAPGGVASLRSRAVAGGTGLLESVGRARSPFSWQGSKLWFVETPHMHVSQLRLPSGRTPPGVGTSLPCEVRFTTISPDVVTGLDD